MNLNKKSESKNAYRTTENNTLMLKMVSSYSIFLLIILFLFVYLYYVSYNNTCNQYNLQNESTFVSNVELFEKDLDIMDIYCRQLLQDTQFRQIMNNSNVDHNFLSYGTKASTSMAVSLYPEALLPVNEVYCYLPESGYILSPSLFIDEERFYSWVKTYPADYRESWSTFLTDSSYYYRFLPMDNFESNSSLESCLYIMNLDDLSYMRANVRVCFLINKKAFSEMFDNLQHGETDNFLIAVDESSNSILALGNQPENYVQEIAELTFNGNFAPFSQNGQNLTIGRYISDNTDYTYYYSFPSFDSTSVMAAHRTAYMIIFSAAFLVGGILILIFSRRNVQPILALGQELHDAVEAQNHLQEVMDNQRPIICRSYVRQLLSASVTSDEEFAYIRDYLSLPEKGYCYNTLYAVVYHNFDDAQGSTSAPGNLPDNPSGIITDALEHFFGTPFYYFNPVDRTYAILLSCKTDEQNDFILRVHNIVLKLHDYLLDTYGIWLFAGIGKNTENLMNVWESYQQATEAVSYTTKNYIFFPYEVIKKNSNVFYYPSEISTKLIHFITTGNEPQVLELINLIHRENIEERSLPVNLLKFLLSDIRNSLLKARFALPADLDSETAKLLDERFNQHLSFKLCEDLAVTLCRLFAERSQESDLVTTIENYIVSNYRDSSLCLNKISDEFQISESYFSHMFKEKTGVNFSTFLENVRMNEAMRLIKESDISLNELYIAVGYNNPNSFRRAFKKIYGVTPSSIREKNF